MRVNGLFFVICCLLPAVFDSAAQPVNNQGMQLITGHWMEIADNATIALPVFSAECWFKCTSGGLIVTRDSPSGTPSDWQLWYEYAHQRIAFITAKSPPDSYFYTPDNSVLSGQWYHLAIVVNGPAGTARVYINGTLMISPTFSSRNFDAQTGLAWGGYYLNGAYLNGLIDEARYWNYERTEAQLNAFMNMRLPLSERSGLNGYWSFCGNFADSSGHHNNGVPR